MIIKMTGIESFESSSRWWQITGISHRASKDFVQILRDLSCHHKASFVTVPFADTGCRQGAGTRWSNSTHSAWGQHCWRYDFSGGQKTSWDGYNFKDQSDKQGCFRVTTWKIESQKSKGVCVDLTGHLLRNSHRASSQLHWVLSGMHSKDNKSECCCLPYLWPKFKSWSGESCQKDPKETQVISVFRCF